LAGANTIYFNEMRTPLLALLALLSVAADRTERQTSVPRLWNGLVQGRSDVGFRHLEGRTQVDVWYPAADIGTRMVYRDYVGDAATGLESFLTGTGISKATVDSLLNSPLMAMAGGRPRTGSFPLVLLSHGNRQSAADQAVLGEFLASHGFVVASTPSPMLRTPMERQNQIAQFAEEQAEDLVTAVSVVANAIPVDTSRLLLVSHSFGARSALLMAMRDPRVRAIVSLDGGIGTATGIDELRAAPSFRADARLPAILHVYEELDEFMKPDLAFLRSLRADTLVLERVQAMHHVHFTTYGFAAAAFPEIARVTGATPETSLEVRNTAVRVLDFIQSRSKP